MAVTADGSTLYLAAFGSAKVGVFATAALERDTFEPNAADHIELSGGGPSGPVLDEERGRLYVLTRFDNGLSVIDTAAKRETHHLRLFNPEPAPRRAPATIPETRRAGRRVADCARSRGNRCGSCSSRAAVSR